MQKARRHGTKPLRQVVSVRFQGLFHSPVRGTFHLSLTVLVRYRSDRNIQAYPTVWADSHGVPRDPCYLGDAIGRPCAFRYGALTLCGPVFNPVPLTHGFLQLPAGPSEPAHAIPQHPARNPRRVSHAQGLAIIRFRSPLLTEYLLLRVLRCFTSPRSPHHPIHVQMMVTQHNPG